VPADERAPVDAADDPHDSDATDDTHDSDATDDGMGNEDANADGVEAAISGEDGLGDPRDGLQDPAENVPTPEVPDIAPDAPDAPEPDSVPEGLRAEFWELVFAANVALFGLSLGAMLVAFDENVSMGVLSLVVGALAAVFLAYRYLNRQHTP
jgi:hypothetical protein